MQQHQFVTANSTTVDQGLVDAIFVTLVITSIISYLIVAFLLTRIFKKAGVKQWIGWVPIYNVWKLLELGGQPGYLSLLSVVAAVVAPVATSLAVLAHLVLFVFLIIAMHNIGKRLGKETWFVLLAIFLPLVWFVWLGFDQSKWKKPSQKAAKNSND